MTKQDAIVVEDGAIIRIHQEDPRYPLLIIEECRHTAGFKINSDGTFTQVCICNARSDNECVCGVWTTND